MVKWMRWTNHLIEEDKSRIKIKLKKKNRMEYIEWR